MKKMRGIMTNADILLELIDHYRKQNDSMHGGIKSALFLLRSGDKLKAIKVLEESVLHD